MKVAVVAARSLEGSGFATRLGTMLRAYAGAGFEIDVIHFCFEHESRLSLDDVMEIQDYATAHMRPARLRQHLSTMPPLAWHLARNEGWRPASEAYDVVQAESSATWAVARSMRASRRIVVFHDDDAVRLRRLASLARSRSRKALTAVSAAKYARWQHRVLQETDEAWFSSSADRDRLVHPARIPETRIVPNGASDDLWSVPPVTQGSRPVALFVGPARYEANRAGVSWFVDHVWRSVRERMPTAQFRVVGAGWNGAIAGRGVSFEGWKPSLLGPYGETSVVVAPLSAGGGTKIKVIEAMAAGRPVVTTAVGAEGLPPAAGLSVIDDAAAFARCVIHYLSDAEASRAAGQANRDAVKDLRWSTIWEAAADHLRVQIGAVR